MAESFVYFNNWHGEFEVGDFAIIWLIIETVINLNDAKIEPESLYGRLQRLIDQKELGVDCYQVIKLDQYVDPDKDEFISLLGKAIKFVSECQWRNGNLLASLKRPEQAIYVAKYSRFGEVPNIAEIVGLLSRFSLATFSATADNEMLRAHGWFYRPDKIQGSP
jgi:hypothetical protein